MDRRRLLFRGFASLALITGTAITSAADRPIRVWSVDFNDPSELERWQVFTEDGNRDRVRVEIVPRVLDDPSQGRVMQVSVAQGLNPRSGTCVTRDLPAEFEQANPADLVIEWEWKIADTEYSDAVNLNLSCGTVPIGVSNPRVIFSSHTRFTISWSVLFDPPNRWIAHRERLRGCVPEDLRCLRKVILEFAHPVKQVVQMASLRLEEWPPGSQGPNELFAPRRAPPPQEPYRDTPLDRLRRTTAGALEDLDGDGFPELLVLERRGYAHLYSNDGRGGFDREATRTSGLAVASLATGAMFLDLDGDGDQDLVLSSEFDVPRFFENRGRLRFQERQVVDDRNISFWYSGTAADVDGDGAPDLLFTAPYPQPYLFLRNRGRWRFEPEVIFDQQKLSGPFQASFADVDGDGRPDLFAGNEHLLRNQGGRLILDPHPWPEVRNLLAEGGVFADFTGDGTVDLLILYEQPPPADTQLRFLVGRGDGSFLDGTRSAGLPLLGVGEVVLGEDFDNDGDIDLYLCQNGQPNFLLLNDGHVRFSDATDRSGLADAGTCEAALAGDVNGDGGVDVVILGHFLPPRVLLNRLARGGSVAVQLAGLAPGTDAIGARVRLIDPATQETISTRWMSRGQGFGSVGPRELHLGMGGFSHADLEVDFPSGKAKRVAGIRPGRARLVREPSGGRLGSIWSGFLEWRFPRARALHLVMNRYWFVAPAIGLIALALGLAVAASARLRYVAVALLLAGLGVTLAVGSTPGRGLQGSAPVLWLLGAVLGAGAPWALRQVLRFVRADGRPAGPPAIAIEEVVRHTLDFRHAGVETRQILSIHARAQNLFLGGALHRPFHEELLAQARAYAERTSPSLSQLVHHIRRAFPETKGLGRLEALVSQLGALLSGLESIGPGEKDLARWRVMVLPLLEEMKHLMPALLEDLDRRCSCVLSDVVREATVVHEEALRRGGVSVALTTDPPGTPVRGLITRNDLLTVVENLFSNAVAALDGSPEPRIDIAIRRQNHRATIEFHDSGRGVQPGLERKIFEHGFTTRPDGKGYGLARSREILGHYGGNITLVEDAARHGATFRITLRAISGGNE